MSRSKLMRATALVIIATTACGPEPVYNDNIDLEAIPVGPGELAGTFAVKHAITTVADIPIVGESEAWGDTYLLLQREYDPNTGTYTQIQGPCGGVIQSTNNVSYVPPEGWQSIPDEQAQALEIRDDDGYYKVDKHLELWGYGNLDDPYEDPLPQDEVEAASPEFVDKIVDTDGDGNIGMTIEVLEGFIQGDLYYAQRKLIDLEGVILGPDRVVGLLVPGFEQTILGRGDGGMIVQGQPQFPHDDPKANWFEEVRIDDGSDCDDVLAAVEDETVSKFTPF